MLRCVWAHVHHTYIVRAEMAVASQRCSVYIRGETPATVTEEGLGRPDIPRSSSRKVPRYRRWSAVVSASLGPVPLVIAGALAGSNRDEATNITAGFQTACLLSPLAHI
jgi:hypothetical protein